MPHAPHRSLRLFAAALALGLVSVGPSAADDVAERAARLHRAAIVVDTHIDLPYALEKEEKDIAVRGATPHFDIPRAREGGLTAPFFAIYVPALYAETGGAARKALELVDRVHRIVEAHPADLVLATSHAGIRRAKKEGRIAVLMGLEGGHALEDSPAILRDLFRLGVRYVTLTHTNTHNWADSSGAFYLPDFDPAASRRHGGLNDLGRAMVREMNRIGMMVDISHVSDDTIDDVLEVSSAPVFASHSSCRSLANIPRNLTDEQIRRVAAKGGVVMINIGSYFLDQAVVDAAGRDIQGVRAEYDRLKVEHAADPAKRTEAVHALLDRLPKRRTGWARAVDHIERVIRVAGPDAVGLGTDFDGIDDPPEGLDDVSKLPVITAELLRRGYSDAVARKVLGENFLAFMQRVEAAAAAPAEKR